VDYSSNIKEGIEHIDEKGIYETTTSLATAALA
jgi:hypothetical protein